MSVFAESTTEGVSSDEMTSHRVSTDATMSLQSVYERYPGSLLYHHFIRDAVKFNRIIFFVWLIIGVVGNSLSAVVWLMRRMRRHNSSAIYVAMLSVNSLVFLVMYFFDALNFQFDIHLYNLPVVCHVFGVLFFVPQYLNQLLVLAFTVDRYIVVCHPLRRQIFCRTSRAVRVRHTSFWWHILVLGQNLRVRTLAAGDSTNNSYV